MNSLEKIILLEIVNKQLGKLPGDNPEYYSTYENLTESEKEKFYKLSPKIHQYWNYINLPKIIPEEIKRVHSIHEYNQQIEEVDPQILEICNDYGLTLKNERNKTTDAFLKNFLGNKYDDFFGDE